MNTIGDVVLCRCLILFIQIIHEKQMQKIKKTFLTLQYCSPKSPVVPNDSWHTGAVSKGTGKKRY